LELFDGVAFDVEIYRDVLINRSVSEWEMRAALQNEDDASRISWLHREFKNRVNRTYEKHKLYDDTIDDYRRRDRLTSLLQWMWGQVPDRATQYSDATFQNYLDDDAVWQMQRYRWTDDITRIFNTSLEKIIAVSSDWDNDACGLGLPGDEATEMLHHYAWAQQKASEFFGREELVDTVVQLITAGQPNSAAPTDGSDISPFSGVCLNITGFSGAGKTSLVAKAADAIFLEQQFSFNDDTRDRPLILRFCGTSPGSSSGLLLVRSICRQIHFLMNHVMIESPAIDVLSMDYDTLVEHFHHLLATYPILLFIDGVDQLSNENLARSNLTFLQGVKPHADTRIVVSTLKDEKHHGKTMSRINRVL
jgi:hypothetical protein